MHQPKHALAPRTEAKTYTDLGLELDVRCRIHVGELVILP